MIDLTNLEWEWWQFLILVVAVYFMWTGLKEWEEDRRRK